MGQWTVPLSTADGNSLENVKKKKSLTSQEEMMLPSLLRAVLAVYLQRVLNVCVCVCVNTGNHSQICSSPTL